MAVEDTGILRGLSKKRKLEIAKALEPGQGSSEKILFFCCLVCASHCVCKGTSFGRASHLQMQGQKSSLALEGDRGIELVEKKTATSLAPGAGTASSNNYFGSAGLFKVPFPPAKKP